MDGVAAVEEGIVDRLDAPLDEGSGVVVEGVAWVMWLPLRDIGDGGHLEGRDEGRVKRGLRGNRDG